MQAHNAEGNLAPFQRRFPPSSLTDGFEPGGLGDAGNNSHGGGAGLRQRASDVSGASGGGPNGQSKRHKTASSGAATAATAREGAGAGAASGGDSQAGGGGGDFTRGGLEASPAAQSLWERATLKARSAGLLMYRLRGPRGSDGNGAGPELEVLLAHMGGSLWAKKQRSWSICTCPDLSKSNPSWSQPPEQNPLSTQPAAYPLTFPLRAHT